MAVIVTVAIALTVVQPVAAAAAVCLPVSDSLRSAGYDFDILDDQAILEQSLISSGKIQTENETFEVLLFPRQDAVRLETIKQAKEIRTLKTVLPNSPKDFILISLSRLARCISLLKAVSTLISEP